MNVFISYRRDDTRGLAGRIADRLREFSDIGDVFLDVNQIPHGTNFRERIGDALSHRPVCIVLIGQDWRGTGRTLRIFEACDPVRQEVASMLTNSLRILPVLADGSRMPGTNELPDDIQALAPLNALPLRHECFDRDFNALASSVLMRPVGEIRRTAIWRMVLRALIGVALSVAIVIVAAAIHKGFTGLSFEDRFGGRGQLLLMVPIVLAVGALAGFIRWRRIAGSGLVGRAERPRGTLGLASPISARRPRKAPAAARSGPAAPPADPAAC